MSRCHWLENHAAPCARFYPLDLCKWCVLSQRRTGQHQRAATQGVFLLRWQESVHAAPVPPRTDTQGREAGSPCLCRQTPTRTAECVRVISSHWLRHPQVTVVAFHVGPTAPSNETASPAHAREIWLPGQLDRMSRPHDRKRRRRCPAAFSRRVSRCVSPASRGTRMTSANIHCAARIR